MSIWKSFDQVSAELEKALTDDNLEEFVSPTGKRWFRKRGYNEAHELRRLKTEHNPDLDKQI